MFFFSLFLEWYSFQAVNERNEPIASWGYDFINGWSTTFLKPSAFNDMVKPADFSVSIVIFIISIVIIMASACIALFRDLDSEEGLEKASSFTLINAFLLILIGIYCFVFPVMFFLENDLYFPFVVVTDNDIRVRYFHSVGPGYYLQAVSFALIVPYSLFYHFTVSKFARKDSTVSKILQNYIESVKEPIDLDKLIAEEKLRLRFNDYIEDTSEESGLFIGNGKIKTKRRRKAEVEEW